MLKIETPSGVYEVKKPSGALGTRDMILMTELTEADGIQPVPDEQMEDPGLVQRIKMSNAKIAQAQFMKVFSKWAPEILPHIVVSGPYKYEDMPGTDQLAIFALLSQEMMTGDKLFRVLPASPT